MKVPILRGGGGSSRELYTLQHLVTQYRGFIAGGYARWALSPLRDPARPSDIDCYFRDLDGMQAFSYALGRSGWRVVGNSAFAVKFTRAYFDLPVHAVCVVGTPGYILDSMDLGICQAVLDHCEGRATYSFEDEERAKVLRIVKPHNLELTVKRIMKYQSRGYTIDDEEMDKLFDLFAVRPLHPGETPFANYEILGVIGEPVLRQRPMSPAEYNARHREPDGSPPVDWSQVEAVLTPSLRPSYSVTEAVRLRRQAETQGERAQQLLSQQEVQRAVQHAMDQLRATVTLPEETQTDEEQFGGPRI